MRWGRRTRSRGAPRSSLRRRRGRQLGLAQVDLDVVGEGLHPRVVAAVDDLAVRALRVQQTLAVDVVDARARGIVEDRGRRRVALLGELHEVAPGLVLLDR